MPAKAMMNELRLGLLPSGGSDGRQQGIEMHRSIRMRHVGVWMFLQSLLHLIVSSVEQRVLDVVVELESPRRHSATDVVDDEGLHVVCDTSGADDEDSLLPERSKSLAQVEVIGSVLVGLDRELAHRHVGFRIHLHEWNPSSMVEPSLCVNVERLVPGGNENVVHLGGKFLRSRSWVLELVVKTEYT